MLVDAVFDIRTVYLVVVKPVGWFDLHLLGEGNPLIFAIVRTPAMLGGLHV